MSLSRLIIVSALTMGLAACGGQSNNTTSAASQTATTSSSPSPNANTLRVAIEPIYPPYVIPGIKGEFNGYDVEVLKAIAERENMNITFTPYPWVSLFERLDSNEADIVAGGLSPNEERKLIMDFTEPYAETTIVLAVPQDSNIQNFGDTKDKKIIYQKDSSDANIWTKNQGTSLSSQNAVDSAWLSFRAIINAKESNADAALGHEAVFSHYLKEYKDSGVKLVKDVNFTTEPMAFAVKKGNAELLNKLNTRLAEMKADGTLAKLHEKWVPHAHNH